jgi:hypothetical protein
MPVYTSLPACVIVDLATLCQVMVSLCISTSHWLKPTARCHDRARTACCPREVRIPTLFLHDQHLLGQENMRRAYMVGTAARHPTTPYHHPAHEQLA